MEPLQPKRRSWLAACAATLMLAGCGGGGGDGGATPAPPPQVIPLGPGQNELVDFQAYSTAADASLGGADEAAAVTKHTLVLNGTSVAYTATAGHLTARDPDSGAAEASFFYVAYTADGGAPAARPVTFFYNGGPGSASVWLHLGSFGPKRLAAGVPATATPAPFPFVDNSESLLDVTDLVFVDAVGTGYSQAIAPYTNRSFWGVDADAAVLRDFVMRWLTANARSASPRFLYGESYGGPRTAVLARSMQAAGVALDGLILQSPALNYNSNCAAAGRGSCAGFLPTYGEIGAFHGLAASPGDDSYADALRSFTVQRYAPAVNALLASGTPPPADLAPLLAGYTGLAAARWQQTFNLFPDTYQFNLFENDIIGRYDGRMRAARGSFLAGEGDPSSTYLTSSFVSTLTSHLRDTLRYRNGSTYVLLSNAIEAWNFGHAGKPLPDTVPDLAAALAHDPALRILSVSGYHDLATPFNQTELDLARLGSTRITVKNYPGGHMSYLDDATRVRQKADLAAFYAGVLQARAARVPRQQPLALRARPAPERVGTVPSAPQSALPQQPLQTPLRDPWVPPERRPLVAAGGT
jgi:carboxypeptidase C (cathepsin A)